MKNTMMAAQRSMVDALLDREAHQSRGGDEGVTTLRLNAVWRQKVMHWYFTLVAALRRQHSAAAVESTNIDTSSDITSSTNPFNRASVHVSASLLDNYLMSLPSERAMRYKHDRPAYQLLATTCLLLGMRLAQHDQIKESRQQESADAANDDEQQGGLKRAKTHRMNMNAATVAPGATAPAVAIPNAATILRISSAPKSITEKHILSMVREMTGSRSFPRSKVVTALDFINALGSSSTRVNDSSVSLGPAEVEEASRLADVLLRDVSFLSCRPSVVACAVITLALARSDSVANLDMSSLRQMVHHSIFGPEGDLALLVSVRQAESKLLVGAPASRNPARRVVPTTHLIPLEDE